MLHITHRVKGHSADTSCHYAEALTSVKLERPGPIRFEEIDEIKECLEKIKTGGAS